MAKKANSKARKKSNGKAQIELEILNPEKFQTVQKIRDFVTGEGAKALHFAIGEVLKPNLEPLDMRYLGDSLEEARNGAFFLNNDLEDLARAAIELEDDAQLDFVHRFDVDKDRRSLLLISLNNDDVSDWVKREIIDHLGGSGCSPEATEAAAHA